MSEQALSLSRPGYILSCLCLVLPLAAAFGLPAGLAPAHAQSPGVFSRLAPLDPAKLAPPPDTRLFAAVAADDLPHVRQLLQIAPGLINLPVPGGQDTGFQTSVPLEEALSERYEPTYFAGPGPPPPPTPQQKAAYAAKVRVRRAIVSLLLDRGAQIRPNQETHSFNSPAYGPRTALHYAILHSTPDLVALLLDRGEDPAARDSTGLTALHLAVIRKNLPAARALLAHGADPNARTASGDTPLALANDNWGCTVGGDTGLPVALELLTHGANPNARDRRGEPLLVRALGNTGIFAALLAHGADVNARNAKGQTPLQEEAALCPACALPFIEHGADVNVRDENGDRPLSIILRQAVAEAGSSLTKSARSYWMTTGLPQYEKVTARLVGKGADVNAPDRCDMTPALYALETGDPRLLNPLLRRGAKLDFLGRAFRAAAQDDVPSLAQALAAHPALADLRTPDGTSLLRAAARWDAAGAEAFLLAHGASAEAQAVPKPAPAAPPSPLTAAVMAYDWETTGRLLAAGADPNDGRGEAPLRFAMRLRALRPVFPYPAGSQAGQQETQRQEGTARAVRLLLEHGAGTNVAGPDGLTPLWYALLNRDRISVDLLTQHGAHGDRLTPLFLAAAFDDVPTLARGLTGDASLARLRGPSGVTLLHVACLWGSLRAAAFLLNHGAVANARDARARTPLEAAAQSGDGTSLTRLLLARHARPGPPDAEDVGPLFWAVAQGETETARLLLRAGADPRATPVWPSPYLGSLLTRAVGDGDEPTARLLLEYEPARTEDLITALILCHRPGPDFVGLLLPKVADVDAPERNGMTALMEAAAIGHVAAVRALLGRGADANARIPPGYTVLSDVFAGRAWWWREEDAGQREEIAALLLAHGADANVHDAEGRTPLLCATQAGLYAAQGHLSNLIPLLLVHGADPNLADAQGNTPLSLVQASAGPTSPNFAEIIRLLKVAGADPAKTKPAVPPPGPGGYPRAF